MPWADDGDVDPAAVVLHVGVVVAVAVDIAGLGGKVDGCAALDLNEAMF